MQGFKISFKQQCYITVVVLFLLSLYVYVNLNRYEQTETFGLVLDKWKGMFYDVMKREYIHRNK